jgi:ribosome biogenesis protein ERB1
VEGRQVVLSPDELNLLQHIQQRRFPADFDAHAKTIEWFSSVTEKMPLTGAPEPKRRFVPSKHEGRRIMQIARAIQLGLIKKKEKKKEKDLFDLWANEQPLPQSHISAPKMALPDHIESYNPPQEYLLTPKEDKEWRDMDPEDRPFNFFPQKFESLRHVPAYDNFIQERFERCLDLYLCPRTIKQKVYIN